MCFLLYINNTTTTTITTTTPTIKNIVSTGDPEVSVVVSESVGSKDGSVTAHIVQTCPESSEQSRKLSPGREDSDVVHQQNLHKVENRSSN